MQKDTHMTEEQAMAVVLECAKYAMDIGPHLGLGSDAYARINEAYQLLTSIYVSKPGLINKHK